MTAREVQAVARKWLQDDQLSVAELDPQPLNTKAARAAVAAKYRNPATGESWSGRGRAPKWLAEELAKGRSREAFLIK